MLQPVPDAASGQRVTLDASGTFDYDGDAITFNWTQVHNPDRYAGTEHITGNEATLERTDAALTAFTPNWPGIYRFSLTATDKDGVSTRNVDVVVRPRRAFVDAWSGHVLVVQRAV